jgi:hypothetical protein
MPEGTPKRRRSFATQIRRAFLPKRVASPAVGLCRPRRQRAREDFPAPAGPRRA